jgi:isorenieratene synthase
MRLPSPLRTLATRAILRELGGYRHAVHHDDPSLPERPSGEAPRVAVVGGGIAGISAAVTLAERGFAVTLLERNAYLGGKTGAWPVQVGDETQSVDHGFHAFFRHYYNLDGLLKKVGVAAHLKAIDDYVVLRTDRSRISFAGTDTVPLLNLLSLASTGVYKVSELLFSTKMHKLDPFLRYDESKTFADWDGVSYDDFARHADLPSDLRLVFNTFARAFFSEGDRLSVAALIRAFHFYYLSNDAGLLYDYLDDDYETAFAAPVRAWFASHGVTLSLGTEVTSLERDGDRWTVNGAPYDAVVLACDVVGACAIAAASSSLATAHPGFTERMALQKTSQRYAILRVWNDRRVGDDLPVFVITDRLTLLDAVTFNHRVIPAARDWAERHRGGVYELHSYAVPDSLPDDAAIERALLAEFDHYFPGVVGAKNLATHLHVRSDFAAFHVGSHATRATVDTGVPGLWLAGDWVRIPHAATLMEAACLSGLLAANGILAARGLREAPVYAVPAKGILSRLPAPPKSM